MPPARVVVVSYRTPALLERCLRGLSADVGAGLAEVVVVDNASGDASADRARAAAPWATVLEAGENLGFGAAANLGAVHQPSERGQTPLGGLVNDWVLVANADTAVRPGALRALVAAGERDPGAGVLAPRLVGRDGWTQPSAAPLPTVARTAAYALGAGTAWPALGDRLGLPGRFGAARERRVDWVHGALLAVRRACWLELGGFDPSLWLHAEDLDLCWRARDAGWATRFVPGAIVEHAGHAATDAAFGGDRARRELSATAALVRGRGGSPRAVGALHVLGALARREPRWAALHARAWR